MFYSIFVSALGLGISPLSINAENINQTGQIMLYNPSNVQAEATIEANDKIIKIPNNAIIPPNSKQIIKYIILSPNKPSTVIISTESKGLKLEYPIIIKGNLIQKINPKKENNGTSVYFGLSIIIGILIAGTVIFFFLKHSKAFR
jgi:hypothetical protein